MMDSKHSIDTPDPHLPDTQEPVHLPPLHKDDDNGIEFTRVRIFILVALFILILFFHDNTLIQTVLAVLGIGTFEPIFNPIQQYSEQYIFKPLERYRRALFRSHLTTFARWYRVHYRLITEVASVIAIVILLALTTLKPFVAATSGSINDYFCLKTSLPWFTCSSGYGISTLPDGVRIGLIRDGSYGSFDKSLLNQDELRIEGLIFAENQRACGSDQHITLIVTTMLSRTVEDPLSGATLGLQNLQGYYLWQRHYNATHPVASLCLAIANLGTPDTANKDSLLVKDCPTCYSMPQVMYQIAQLAHFDPSVRGIAGFPYSQQAREALDLRDNYSNLANLSIISPSASSDNLSDRPNFFRIDAPDKSQGEAMARFFCSALAHGKSASTFVSILLDAPDPYSGDLPLDFKNSLSCVDPASINAYISYTNGDSQSIRAAIDTAVLRDHAQYIFFPGYDEDLDTIEAELHSLSGNVPSNVVILGGDGLNNVDATTHYAYNIVYAASFAQPFAMSDAITQDFKNMGFAKPYFAQRSSERLWVPKDTLLAVDAVKAFTQTIQSPLLQANFTQNDFNAALKSINFVGESGEILFQGDRVTSLHRSDRDHESVYITCYDHRHTLNLMASYIAVIDSGAVSENSADRSRQSCT